MEDTGGLCVVVATLSMTKQPQLPVNSLATLRRTLW